MKPRICKYCQRWFEPSGVTAYYCSMYCKFWSKVRKTDNDKECWEWIGLISPNGYGRIGGKSDSELYSNLAHRVGYIIAKGDIDKNLLVTHTCSNRICVNPAHLVLHTQSDIGWRNSAQDNNSAYLSTEKIHKIVNDDRIHAEISAHYQVSVPYICHLKRGLIRKAVNRSLDKRQENIASNRVRLTYEDGLKIKNDPRSSRLIAMDYGVTAGYVRAIKNNRAWNKEKREYKPKYTKELVEYIRQSKETYEEIQKKFNLSKSAIQWIRSKEITKRKY